MDLIVEDGSIVENANSYVSLNDARDYADIRGLSELFSDDGKLTAALIRAMDYLNAINDYQGSIVDDTQNLPWPRQKVVVSGIEVFTDTIPYLLKKIQIELATAVLNGIELFPATGKKIAAIESGVKREKVGPLETEYFNPRVATFEPLELSYIKRLLDSFRIRRPALRTIRV